MASSDDGLKRNDSASSNGVSRNSSQNLRLSMNRAEELHKLEAHAERHHHEHSHSKEPSLVSAVISGFVNYLLMFGLCCAYGMIMFTDDFNGQHRALGVKLNLLTSLLGGLWCAGFSKIPVAIGGPDLNPVVFLGAFVNVLSEGIAANVGLDDFPGSEGRRLMEDSTFSLSRRLGGGGGGGGIDWCMEGGYHMKKHMEECLQYHESLRATTIFAVTFSSGILGLLFWILGRFRITRVVSYVPTSVQEAFLSCIGYKVFKYALLFTNYAPMQFIPAACIGVTLYFLKAMHIGNPAIVIPGFIMVPLGIFHAIVAIAGLDINTMRTPGTTDNWMFPELAHCDFWELWTGGIYGSSSAIDFKAWMKTLPDFASMVIVCLIDCLLKISATPSKLPVECEKDYEAELHGVGNIFTTATGASVGYMQLKFNVINYGVIGNVTDRRAGVVYALLCGACFFGTIGHFNFLPRFFLGLLLFFAGSGFVAENLWGSRKYLSFAEWSEILVILAVFIFSSSLVAAVLAGILLTCVSLILKYAKISAISGKPLKGGQVTSCVRRHPLLERQMRHFGDSWFAVVRLKGFIFFASAQKLCATIMNIIQEREELPHFRHLRYLILDCELLDGMDASAGKSIRKLRVDAEKMHCKVIWSDVDRKLALDLHHKEMISNVNYAFINLDSAILYIEYSIMEYQKHLQAKWLEVDPMFKLQHNLARFEHEQDPWSSVLTNFTARRGCPWKYCDQLTLEACVTVLWGPGQTQQGLYLLHSGRVALFEEMPSEDAKDAAWSTPVAVYSHGWFLNRDFVIGMPTKFHAVAIDEGEALYWTREHWWKMFAERPNMAGEIWKAVASQQEVDSERTHAILEHGSMHTEDFHEEVPDLTEKLEDEQNLDEDAEKAYETEAYCDVRKASLPDQLKALVDALEIADAFGAYGAFLTGQSDFDFLPRLPNSIREDLDIAFNTYSVTRNGESVVPADQTMAALAYAGVSRAALVHSGTEFFTQAQFVRLGHEASMARMPIEMATKLQDLIKLDKKKEGWQDGLDAHQFSAILRTRFHRSLNPMVVKGLLTELGQGESDETIFVSMFSRLLKVHEQYWVFLVSLRNAARLNPEDDIASINIFTSKALATKMNAKQEEVKHDLEDHGMKGALTAIAQTDRTVMTLAFEGWAQLIKKAKTVDLDMAAEMLWACDWPRRNEVCKFEGERHIYDVALAILTCNLPPTGHMHPPPVLEAPANKKVIEVDDMAVDVSDLMLQFSATAEGIYQSIDKQVEFPFKVMKVDLEALQDDLYSDDEEKEEEYVIPFHERTLKQRIYLTMEEPTSSRYAFWTSNVMAVFIMISVLSLFVRPVIEHGRDEDDIGETEKLFWFVFEAFLTTVFTLEFIIRVSVANAMGTETRCKYILHPGNICDLAAITPFYFELMLGSFAQALRLLRVIRLLRLARVARLARLSKRSEVMAPIAMCLLVIWGIYMKSGLSDKK